MSISLKWERIKKAIRKVNHLVTIELMLILFCLTLPITQFGMQDLLYQKICLRKANTNETLCNDKKWTRGEQDIEGETSLWSMYINIATLLPSIFTTIIYGSVIDQYGFSVPLKLPLIGTLIGCGLTAIIAGTDIHHEFLLIGMIIMGACGHSASIVTAFYAYVIKDSDYSNRTFRIAVVGSCLILAIATGFGVVGPIIDQLGLHWLFLMGAFCALVALADSVFRLRNPRNETLAEVTSTTGEKLREIFGFQTIKSYVRVITRRRSGSVRLRMYLMTAVFVLSYCALIGVIDVEFLYLTKEKRMSNTTTSIFVSVSTLLSFLATIVSVQVLVKRFSVSLIYMTVIGSASSIISYAGFSLADSLGLLWTFNVIKMFTGLTSVCSRSYISGCVELSDQGLIMSFAGVVEAVFKLIASLLFNGLYPATLSIWPGMVLMIAAVMCAASLPILGYMRYRERKEENYNSFKNEPEVGNEIETTDTIEGDAMT